MRAEPPPKILSEQEIEDLLNRIANKDHKACVALFNYFRPQVIKQVKKTVFADEYTIDGIVNEVFYAAFAGIASFRRDGDFGAFLGGIARNLCKNFIARRYRGIQTSELEDAHLDLIPDEAPGPEERMIEKQDHEALYHCIDKLPEKAQDVIRATYLGELSEAESAALFKIDRGTVKSRLYYAKRKLQKCMDNWRTGGRNG